MDRQRLGEAYARFEDPGDHDTIVIGSGIGGLASASLLARHAGRRPLVLERHYTAGGFTHTFRRPGYEWDVGVHYIGDVGRPEAVSRKMFDAVGDGSLDWAAMPEVYDRVFLGERAYDLPAGRDNLRDRLTSYFPAERDAIERYLALVREASRGARGYFTSKVLPGPLAAVAGPFMARKFLRLASRTTLDVLSELTGSRELIAVLTGQLGDYGLPPARSSFAMHAILVRHYMDGGWYPIGGSAAIAGSIVPAIEERGGRVVVNAEVRRILVEGRKAVGVEMADGRRFTAPLVISDAGARNTFGHLLPQAPQPVETIRRELEAIGSSAAHLCLYVGLDASDDELGLAGTNLWIYPDASHDDNIARFLADPRAPIPLVYVSFPSRKDPAWPQRFPGKATVEVVTLASYDWFREWEDRPWKRRGEAYDRLKEEFTERLLATLYEHVPQLRGHVAVAELSSPLSTRWFTGYSGGEIYGLAHTPRRFHSKHLRPVTPVRGLYLTGQDVATCGVVGALFSGAMTASAVCGKNLVGKILGNRDGRGATRAAV